MKESENVVNKMVEEHKYVDENIGKVEDSVSDINALALLEQERSKLMLSSRQAFSDKLNSLDRSLDSLVSGLKKHFVFEEEYFLKLLDKNVSKQLSLEHLDISSEFEKVSILLKKLCVDESLPQEEFLTKKMEVVNMVTNISHLLREHAMKEDNLLREMKKEPKSPTGTSL